jgi:hypothetical protein
MYDKNIVSKYIRKNKVYILPSKKKNKMEVLSFFASLFETKKNYTEKEVNKILNKNHDFNDPATIRRELVDNSFIKRDKWCKKYWKE